VPRGHLGFCHYERSEVIQKQVLLANRLLHSFRVRNDMFRGVIANVVWRSVGDEIASTTPQVWLVAGSHLGFAKNLARLAMTRGVRQVFSRVPRIAGQRTCGKYKRRVVITSVLGMEARQGSDSLDFFWTFGERG